MGETITQRNTRHRSWLAALLLLTSGCYLHHERPDGGDAGALDGALDDAGAHPVPDGALVDGDVDAGPQVRCVVPDEYPTLQAALDDARCDVILLHGLILQVDTAHVTRDVTLQPFDIDDDEQDALHGGLGVQTMISIEANAHVTLEDLVVMDGRGDQGGAIHSEGHLTLRRVSISDNQIQSAEEAHGGAIYQRGGSLHLDSAIFQRNEAESESSARGGAVYVEDAQVRLEGTNAFAYNVVTGGARAFGAGLAVVRSQVTIDGEARFEGNIARAIVASSPTAIVAAGGLYAFDSSVEIRGASFTSNQAVAHVDGASNAAVGAGLACEQSTLTLSEVRAEGNVARASGTRDTTARASGGFMTGTRCSVTLTDVALLANLAEASNGDFGTAVAGGGAVHCGGPSVWQVHDSQLRDNAARATISGERPTTVATFDPGSHARGGAIMNVGCDLTVDASLLIDNTAEVIGSDQRGHDGDAACGGAIAMVEAEIAPTLLSTSTIWHSNQVSMTSTGDAVASGGAACFIVYAASDFEAHFVSSSLHSNEAIALPVDMIPGIVDARGGAVSLANYGPQPATVSFHNATVAENHVGGGSVSPTESGAGVARAGHASELVVIANSIFWSNTAGPMNELNDCSDTFISHGYNFVLPECVGASSMDYVSDLTLSAPLQCEGDHPPCFYVLPPNSPAVNAGDPNGCTDHNGTLISTDQRGMPRNGRCDVGAYEQQ